MKMSLLAEAIGRSNRLKNWCQLLTVVMLIVVVSPVTADVVLDPIRVATSDVDGATLGIPRWKGYVSEFDPNDIWLSFANSGGSPNTMVYSTDAGVTWSDNTITIDGYLDFHLSLFGRGSELYFTSPGISAIIFRKFIAPAQSNDDAGPLIELSNTSAQHRSNIMVEPGGRIWIFTRDGGNASENVRYQYSDNDGASWTTGRAWATGAPDVRIGSMPVIDGRPALVVLHLNDDRGYQYYLWNGEGFEAPGDYSIFPGNFGYTRAFTHNVVHDTTMHLILGQGNDLVHVWKDHQNGIGSWNSSTIESSPFTLDNDWFPISSVIGDNLFVFYCRKSSEDFASSMIYYRKWTQATQTWSDAVLVSTDPDNVGNRDPNTCFQVPVGAGYVPVFWWSSGNPLDIYFTKVVVNSEEDLIPPGRVIDLGLVPGSGGPVQSTGLRVND